MFASLLQFLFLTATSILGCLLVLRAWTYACAMTFHDPIVYPIRRLTNWLVDPLSKMVAPRGRGTGRVSSAPPRGTSERRRAHGLSSGGLCDGKHLDRSLRDGAPLGPRDAHLGHFRLGDPLLGRRAHPFNYSLSILLEPFMRPVRRVLPTFRGMDFSPLVVLLAANAVLLFILPLSDGRILF